MRYLLILLFTLPLLAEVDITRPQMTLTHMDGTPVEGLTKSVAEVYALEKASNLPNGKYLLKRPDMIITVTNNLPVAETSIAFTGVFGIDVDDGSKVTYSWEQISGEPILLMPADGSMTFSFGFELPTGLRFNILAVEDK